MRCASRRHIRRPRRHSELANIIQIVDESLSSLNAVKFCHLLKVEK